jgi:predicted metal-dependent HD superfamily phosphohydrolase
MSEPALRERFTGLWRRLGAKGDAGPAFDQILRNWQEPHRRYHGLDHLRDCLARLDEAPAAPGQRDLAEAALWYHDVVYRPGATDNEARSAELAHGALIEGGVAEVTADEVARLIRLTDHAAPAEDPLAALVCDVDLSILGRDVIEFANYERRIREEYRHVPDPLYRAGRSRVLTHLVAREPLFRTAYFRSRFEAPARRNLRHALDAMAMPPGSVTQITSDKPGHP